MDINLLFRSGMRECGRVLKVLPKDEIGTPMCVTIDFDTLEDGAVTVRDRDTMEQERIKICDLENYIANKIKI